VNASSEFDILSAVGKFYSQFYDIILKAVLGKQNSEMTAVHLMKTYYLSSLMYACEA